ncbi:metal tolerance protein B [Ricinus communis]|uniref:metal tolerance protein B n=1 Tax=Ricinus communis TaxID=3988 RepID=UPI00201B1E3C|nr:metal tolerance protein B [Ricinus communis]XP_025013347.2 metal tolerance protein B [Ricinus communis]XP_025013348.2 metal tolerance protein B [Ricinus communis]
MEYEEVPILQSQHQKDIEMAIASEEKLILPITSKLSCSCTCAFSNQGNDTTESDERSKLANKLLRLIIVYLIVMAVEIIGGLRANSLAIITDAAHLLTDVAGFSVSLFAVWASGWKATSHQSFGFSRLEVLGALLSVQLIWLIVGVLIYEAVNRIFHESAGVNGALMFAIAAFGFIINLLMIMWLGHDHAHHAFHDHNHEHNHSHHAFHDHEHGDFCAVNKDEGTETISSSPEKTKVLNINIQGAHLHLMVDLIQSIGAMIVGAIIWAKPNWLVVDLICTLLFSVLVLCSTIAMLRNVFYILMESTPSEISIDRLESGLKCIEGVQDIHDLHVWAITVGKLVLSCHVETEPGASSSEILNRIRDYCEKTYRIRHVTIQIEQ